MQETIDRLEREHSELTQQLEEAQEKIHQLGEQVLAKQLEIDANNARIDRIQVTHLNCLSLYRYIYCGWLFSMKLVTWPIFDLLDWQRLRQLQTFT